MLVALSNAGYDPESISSYAATLGPFFQGMVFVALAGSGVNAESISDEAAELMIVERNRQQAVIDALVEAVQALLVENEHGANILSATDKATRALRLAKEAK